MRLLSFEPLVHQNIGLSKYPQASRNPRHRSYCNGSQRNQYSGKWWKLIEDGKLWRLRGGTAVRARSRVECVTKAEAKELAIKQHSEGGHWGCDAIKITLTDRIYSPKLDASILHSLLEPITRRHPFELLVGDYLTLPKAKGFHTLGVYLDTFSQHVWAFKYKTAGTAKTTTDSLGQIFRNFTAAETFMSDGGRHFNNAWVNGLVEGTNKIMGQPATQLARPS